MEAGAEVGVADLRGGREELGARGEGDGAGRFGLVQGAQGSHLREPHVDRALLQVRPFVEEYTLRDGRRVHVLADGRLINLASAEGHPASVMDMSFANQALSAEYMAKNADKLEKKVYSVPTDIENEIARLKLEAMGVKIDTLTPEQVKYLGSWEEGT